MFYSGSKFVAALAELGVTHAVWVPDSALGVWEQALEDSPDIQLVRVCREGEAWPIAAGSRHLPRRRGSGPARLPDRNK